MQKVSIKKLKEIIIIENNKNLINSIKMININDIWYF